MSFASPMFLWYFMPAVLGAYWLLPARARNWVIAVASLLFYAWGAGSFVLLLLGCMVLNFASGLAIDGGWLKARRRLRSALLVATVGADLSILVIWKYAGFGSTQLHHLFPDVPILHILLPIGISFFTFHHLSYVVTSTVAPDRHSATPSSSSPISRCSRSSSPDLSCDTTKSPSSSPSPGRDSGCGTSPTASPGSRSVWPKR